MVGSDFLMSLAHLTDAWIFPATEYTASRQCGEQRIYVYILTLLQVKAHVGMFYVYVQL